MKVHEAVSMGTEMMKHYESTRPGGFYDTLSKNVLTMAMTKKHTQVGSADAGILLFHISPKRVH